MTLTNSPEFLTFTLVLMRVTGAIVLNPIFGRRNIPSTAKGGLIFVISIITMMMTDVEVVTINSTIFFVILLLKELAVGFLFGYVMQLFEMIVTYAGAFMDNQMGLAMANVYDPQSGTQMAITGTIFQTFFLLIFFAVDGHLVVLRMIIASGDIVPYGELSLGPLAFDTVLLIFVDCITLMIRLAFPIIAFEFLVEAGMGVLMRMIPQINLFVLSIQLRVVVGLFILYLLSSTIMDYMNSLMEQMYMALEALLLAL